MIERAVLVEDDEDVFHFLPQQRDVVQPTSSRRTSEDRVGDEIRRNVGLRVGLRRHEGGEAERAGAVKPAIDARMVAPLSISFI